MPSVSAINSSLAAAIDRCPARQREPPWDKQITGRRVLVHLISKRVKPACRGRIFRDSSFWVQ